MEVISISQVRNRQNKEAPSIYDGPYRMTQHKNRGVDTKSNQYLPTRTEKTWSDHCLLTQHLSAKHRHSYNRLGLVTKVLVQFQVTHLFHTSREGQTSFRKKVA